MLGLFISILLFATSHAIVFDARLKPAAHKCYTEEISANVLFVAEVHPRDAKMPVEVTVSMRFPKDYFFNDSSVGPMKTAFTVPKKGHVDVCLRNHNKNQLQIATIRLLSGALARDFSQIARKEHLDPAVAELHTVEEHIKDYRTKQMYLVGKEQSARAIVESTHTRVVLLAGVNVAVLIICNAVTVLFLRSFFRAKKII